MPAQTYLFDSNSAETYPFELAQLKTGARWGAEVIKAMGANLLVVLAAWQAQAAQDIIGKIFGIWCAFGHGNVICRGFGYWYSITATVRAKCDCNCRVSQ